MTAIKNSPNLDQLYNEEYAKFDYYKRKHEAFRYLSQILFSKAIKIKNTLDPSDIRRLDTRVNDDQEYPTIDPDYNEAYFIEFDVYIKMTKLNFRQVKKIQKLLIAVDALRYNAITLASKIKDSQKNINDLSWELNTRYG